MRLFRATQPASNPNPVNGKRHKKVLKVGFSQANVPRPPELMSADAFGQSPLNASTCGIVDFEGGRRLTLTGGL